jgi:hypothetical protein
MIDIGLERLDESLEKVIYSVTIKVLFNLKKDIHEDSPLPADESRF